MRFAGIIGCAVISALSPPALAQENLLNLYSSRHYQTDEALYANFTKTTGIKLNRIEAGEDPLIERLKNEGTSSPADVLVTVDAGRLWRAEQMGLFQSIDSKVLTARLPDHMRTPNNQWFGFSARARVIIYNRTALKAADVQNYEDLADPKLKGKVCTRSGSHVYNLSLMSALIEHWGEAKAEQWARAVVANFTRSPKGGDTDQILAVAAGECGVAISNSYYYVRLLASPLGWLVCLAWLGATVIGALSFGTMLAELRTEFLPLKGSSADAAVRMCARSQSSVWRISRNCWRESSHERAHD